MCGGVPRLNAHQPSDVGPGDSSSGPTSLAPTTPVPADPVPADPALVAAVFGGAAPTAQAYHDLLVDEGVLRGLIGPREVPRLWDRHIFNCALLAGDLQTGTRLADVGSGAGLPGLVVAIARPDVEVTLIDSLLRRTTFLEEAVAALGLENVRVVRGRAEECVDLRGRHDVVTARAVAALDKLVRVCAPLVRRPGRLLAIKGEGAADEVVAAEKVLRSVRARASVRQLQHDALPDSLTVVEACFT